MCFIHKYAFLENPEPKETERTLLKLTLGMMHFQQGHLTDVKSIFSSFHRTDQWYLNKMGNEWLCNLIAMEVLLHIDLENDQLTESRI